MQATVHILEHIREAWRAQNDGLDLGEQDVILTVPASFDAAARELTREAALASGLPAELILLEEPQAAVYAWMTAMGERWRRVLPWRVL